MSAAQERTGYFVFSLDMELAWGRFDQDQTRAKILSPDGSRERRAMARLLDILDEFGIVGTFAIVGHLFYAECEGCAICPVLDWRDKYQSFAEIYKTNAPLWYGADIIETLLTRGPQHEIAFHGYTHEVFAPETMSEEAAVLQIHEWLRVAKRKGVTPRTVIFPRDQVNYLHLFRRAGFICYRSAEKPGRVRLGYVGKLLKSIDHILGITTPPVYDLDGLESCGMVNLRPSQHFFGFNRRLEGVLDSLNLHRLRIRRMVKAIRSAAEQGKIVHIWAHPWEFRSEKDFDKLRYLLDHVAGEMAKGRIQSVGMARLAEEVVARSGTARQTL